MGLSISLAGLKLDLLELEAGLPSTRRRQRQPERRRLGYETRSVPSAWVELRDSQAGALAKLVGYPIVFNSLSAEIRDQAVSPYPFRERVHPGALDQTLADGHDIRALADHDPGQVLGRTSNNTLSLTTTDHGLRCEILPSDTPWSRATVEAIRRQTSRHMSFGFTCLSELREERTIDGRLTRIRTLLRIDLHEVSVVVRPAYSATEIAVEARAQRERRASA